MKRIVLLLAVALCSFSALAAQKDKVWVTIGEDVFDQLARAHGVLSLPEPLQVYDADAGVVVTQLPVRDLEAVSRFVHANFRRCSGFVVHDSLAEARAALAQADRQQYQAVPADFEVDQQQVVQQLLPQLQKANILGTISHLSTNYNNRYYLNASGQQAALWIHDLWQGYATGRSDVTVATYAHSGYVQPSVILTITGATLPSEVVVLGGHLDSIRSGADNTNPATIAPGADDNASGIATLSEVVRVLLASGWTPDRTVKVMGYAAEEVGLRGSGDIAAAHLSAGTNVVAVLQLDMTDYYGSVEDIALIADYTNAPLTAFVGELVDTYQPALLRTSSSCGYACSDHASWHNRGFPTAMAFESRVGQHNPTIHSGNDTLATLGNSADHALKFAQLALAFAVETGAGDCTPAPVADAGVDRTICAGEPTQIGTAALPGHGYSWSPGGAATALVTVSPAVTTTYTVTATTSCGTAQDAVTVQVDAGAGGGLSEDFEGGLGAWSTSGLWHLVTSSSCASPGYSSATRAVYYGQDSGCSYSTGGATTGDLISPVISGVNAGSTLDFDYFRQVESYTGGSYDRTEVAVAVAGSGAWTTVWSRDSTNASENAWTPSGSISLAAFAGSDVQLRFRFNSVDGTANTFTGWLIDDVEVTGDSPCGPSNTPPSVTISAPTSGATVTAGQSVAFAGTATDAEDGVLTAGLSWSSSLDGAIGTGGSFATSSLSVGTHTITAAVTDAGGLPGSDAVTLTVNPVSQPVTVTFTSTASQDGWVRESSETSSVGGTVAATNSGTRSLRIGDATQDRQYKSILSFNTAAIPDTAVIQSATLRLRRGTVFGLNPFTSGFGDCLVDVVNGAFSGSTTLQSADFQAAATATAAAVMSSPAANLDWSEGALNGTGLTAVNRTGTTQLRVYFTLGDNDNGAEDHLGAYAAEQSGTASDPQLVVTYLP